LSAASTASNTALLLVAAYSMLFMAIIYIVLFVFLLHKSVTVYQNYMWNKLRKAVIERYYNENDEHDDYDDYDGYEDYDNNEDYDNDEEGYEEVSGRR
jgi:hypothetical protein